LFGALLAAAHEDTRRAAYDGEVALRPLVLISPSMTAAVELPRRLASTAGACAAIYAFRPRDLARAIAEPALLGAGLRAWDSGHDALLAAHLLDGPHGLKLDASLPRPPVARALARTLSALRRAGVAPDALDALARGDAAAGAKAATSPEDRERLRALGGLYRRFHETCEGRTSDPATHYRAAAAHIGDARWLDDAELLLADEPETEPLEREFLAALAQVRRVRLLAAERPAGLRAGSFAAWAEAHGIAPAEWRDTPLAPLRPPDPPAGLRRLRATLFEPPAGAPVRDGSVELVTAAGEAAEVRAVVRRLLRAAAAGVPFEEMGVVLPRPEDYAALFTDALERLGVPFRLHPSLPLRFGRCARALLLLFRCRGLERGAVMEFLTFAPVPFEDFLAEGVAAQPSRWDEISRDARIVSGLERWMIGLRHFANDERDGAARESAEHHRARRAQTADDAEALLRVVELLSSELDALAGEATWPEWSERLKGVVDRWIAHDRDREAVVEVIADLGGLGAATARARWDEVEGVIEARFEWERLPLDPVPQGAVHVGALDAMAGLPFRVLAIVGLVEGGYPGVIRPDPFLLDGERAALEAFVRAARGEASRPPSAPTPALTQAAVSTRGPARAAPPQRPPGAATREQLSLFDVIDEVVASAADGVSEPPPRDRAEPSPLVAGDLPLLPTTQDRVLEARRLFQRAVRQAGERLILSYPRADARSGRERLPSLFFVAAASALEGEPLTAARLEALVAEDALDALAVEDALDRGERDRVRVRAGGREAAEQIAAGSTFFKQSRLASEARWSSKLTAYDGLVFPLPPELAARLDPATAARPVSASQLALYARCGFQYMLRYVLGLEPALEPEERKRLDPLERGTLFHEVAERFLRERRSRGELPVQDAPELRARLREIADEALQGLVEGSPPRFLLLWERERTRFHETAQAWLTREARLAERSRPAHFEVVFGSTRELAEGEPHSPEPLVIELDDERRLRVTGRIDRIDRRDDGLVLRDYKTGRAPKDDGRVFRGGQQLQIPFYVLAARSLFPGETVVEAFLDYVDGGRQVAFDPALAGGEAFTALLRGLTDAIAQGLFVQEPAACDWCDYKVVCGPKPLLQLRRAYKLSDPKLQRVLKLKTL
jgi:RecB family exonuclease